MAYSPTEQWEDLDTNLSADLHPVIKEFCQARGIPDDFALLNLQYLEGAACIEKALCVNNVEFSVSQPDALARAINKRFGYLEDGAIWFRSLDISTLGTENEKDSDWSQCRPVNPSTYGDGKKRKYESPAGRASAATICRMPGQVDYWANVLTNALPVVIVEGAGKAAAVMLSGTAAIALPGIWNAGQGAERRNLIPEVATFVDAGCPIYIGFDNDLSAKTRRTVALATDALASLIEEDGGEVHIIEWERLEGGKGAPDDLLAARGKGAVQICIDDRKTYASWKRVDRGRAAADNERDLYWGLESGLVTRKNRQGEEVTEASPISGGAFLRHLLAYYGPALRYNKRTNRVELHGQPVEKAELAYLRLQQIGWKPNKMEIDDAIMAAACHHTYDPVVEDLERVRQLEPLPIDNLSAIWFGVDTPLANAYIRKMLIAMVARAYNPGCKVDTVLILKGEQGQQKSKFWKALTNGYFADDVGDLSDKDQLMKAHRSWVMEWAEIDSKTSSYHAGKLKNQISIGADLIRLPYAKDTNLCPRAFVICGSTNEQHVLHDGTGDRRYWVIGLPITWKIPILDPDTRDRILAGAIQAYETGEQWWLTDEEEELRKEQNADYRASTSWEEEVEAVLYGRERPLTSITWLIETVTGKSKEHQDPKMDKEFRRIITNLGWRQDRNPSQIDGKRVRAWRLEFPPMGVKPVEPESTAVEPVASAPQAVAPLPEPKPVAPTLPTAVSLGNYNGKTRVRYVPKAAHLGIFMGRMGWVAGHTLPESGSCMVKWDEGHPSSVPAAELRQVNEIL